MGDQELVVTDVTMEGDRATITFKDGHSVVFEGYRKGPGHTYEGMRHFFLFAGDIQVVQYDGRLRQAGPSEDEYRLVQLADGYTLTHVVMYWESAIIYLDEAYRGTENRPHELHLPWFLGDESRIHLHYIKDGHVPPP